jgi:hypothetical protein
MDRVDCHVEYRGWSWWSRWIRNWGSSVVAPAESPAAEQDEQADQGRSDHRAGRGEDPVIERDLLGQLLGLLGHGLQLMK